MKKILLSVAAIMLTIQFSLKAQNTGPVSPEASSFEPVDATDMVNLVTGDFSYVLPLINIPSPEGGYSMALSYHGGIAMDQEASWVGLGWNITPGAINRSVNGFADDWNGEKVIGYTNIDPKVYAVYSRSIYLPLEIFGLPSIGFNISFGSYHSFGGSIGYAGASLYLDDNGNMNMGYGFGIGDKNSPFGAGVSLGSDGFGVNVGVSKMLGKSFAASASVGLNYDPSSGSFDANAGAGISVGASKKDKNGDMKFYSFGTVASVGFSINSGGLMAEYKGVGISTLMFGKLSNSDFSEQVLKNDNVNLIIVSWGNYKVKYWAYKQDINYTYGTLNIENARHSMADCEERLCSWPFPQKYEYESDIYNIPVDYTYLNNDDEYDCNENLIFPAYDNYSVSAQGISGSITPRLLKSGLLAGNGRVIEPDGDGKQMAYFNFTYWNSGDCKLDENQKKYFYFDNEPVSYFSNTEGTFSYPDPLTGPEWNNQSSSTNDYSFSGGQSETMNSSGQSFYKSSLKRKGSARPVEWFTNNTIKNDGENAKLRGFMESYDITSRGDDFPDAGIGAFTITDVDGKKYYFSLPVYQFEEFTRSYNGTDKYLERRNLGSYAYTWLLTAITGPDYVDLTGNGPSTDDFGYWVKFSYGKWTDGYIWQMPYTDLGKEKPYHWGRKQVYYLNSIQTRTHIAYFIKKLREDSKSAELYSIYQNHQVHPAGKLNEDWSFSMAGCHTVFYIAECLGIDINTSYEDWIYSTSKHYSLLLDRILLVPNKHVLYNNYGSNFIPGLSDNDKAGFNGGSIKSQFLKKGDFPTEIDCDACPDSNAYNGKCLTYDCNSEYQERAANIVPYTPYNIYYQDKIIDINDIPTNFEKNNAIKVIKFNYDYSLCNNTPNSDSPEKGKLTLKSVSIFGRNMTQTMPPYIFNYNIKGDNTFNLDNKDLWGYDKNNPDNWSLSSIINPVGSKFSIAYEPDQYIKEAVYNGLSKRLTGLHPSSLNNLTMPSSIDVNSTFNLNDLIFIESGHVYCDCFNGSYYYDIPKNKFVSITSIDGASNKIGISYDFYCNTGCNSSASVNIIYFDKSNNPIPGGGLRVSQISVTNPSSNETQTTKYTYSNGITTYAPHDFEFYVPYQSEIAPPMVYYGNVEVKTIGSDGTETGKTQYCFETPAVCEGDFSGSAFTMGNQFKVENLQLEKGKLINTDGGGTRYLNLRSSKITNNIATLGRMLWMKVYNKVGNLVSSTTNNYKTPEQINQGIVQETFLNFKNVIDWQDGYTKHPDAFYMVSASRAIYPNFLDNTVNTSNNITSTVYYDNYDFKTGNVLEQTTVNSNGKTYKSVTVPAYEKYPEMGPAYDNFADPENPGTNKNMLSQPAAAYNYVNGNLLNASVQTWNNSWDYRENPNGYYEDIFSSNDIWRKHKTFAWKGEVNPNGTYKDFTDFNWNLSNLDNNSSNGWQKTSEITRYNHFSLPMESKDINGNYASTKTGYNESYVIASAANASYTECTYTGFEDDMYQYGYFGGEVKKHTGSTVNTVPETYPVNSTTCHTGTHSLQATSGTAFEYKMNEYNKSKSYVAMVWVRNISSAHAEFQFELFDAQDNLVSTLPPVPQADHITLTSGEWKLFTINFPEQESSPTAAKLKITCNAVSGTVIFDDFRVQPLNASMNCYVYDEPTGQVTAIFDNQHIATKYKYDDAGRLITSYKETENGFNKTGDYKMEYKILSYYPDFTCSHPTLKSGDNITCTIIEPVAGYTYEWEFQDAYETESTTETSISHICVEGSANPFKITVIATDQNGRKSHPVSKYFIFDQYYCSISNIYISKVNNQTPTYDSYNRIVVNQGGNITLAWEGINTSVITMDAYLNQQFYYNPPNVLNGVDITLFNNCTLMGSETSTNIPSTIPIGGYTYNLTTGPCGLVITLYKNSPSSGRVYYMNKTINLIVTP